MGDHKPGPQGVQGGVQDPAEASGAGASEAAPCRDERGEPCRDDQGNWYPPDDADPLDEASMDSFPCSDPPSHTSHPATPSDPDRPAATVDPTKPPNRPR